jgi:hypothetical protein
MVRMSVVLRVRAHGVGQAVGEHLAVVQHGDAVGEREDDVHVVLDDEHRDLARQGGEQARHPLRLLRRHPRRGLIEQEQLRGGRQRHADLELPLLAVRQPARLLAETAGQAHRLRHLARRAQGGGEPVDGAEGVPRAALARRRRQSQVLQHRQAREEIRALEGARDPAARDVVRGQPGERSAVEHDAARARRQVAGDEVEDRRLAGAVGPDERAALARRHLERHAVDGAERAEIAGEALDGQQAHARSPMRPRSAPTIPPGAKSTNTMKVRPRMSIHRSV